MSAERAVSLNPWVSDAMCILKIAWVYHYLARNPVECDLREGARVPGTLALSVLGG